MKLHFSSGLLLKVRGDNNMTKRKNRPAALGNPSNSKQFYGNSYATQRARILKEFEIKQQISTFYFRDILGIVHPAGRIRELREHHKILLSWTREPDQNGVIHRIGLYIYHGLNSHGEV